MPVNINLALVAPTPLNQSPEEESRLKDRLRLKELTYAKVDVLYEINEKGERRTVYEIWRGVRTKPRLSYSDVVGNAMVLSVSRKKFEDFLRAEARIRVILTGGPHGPGYGKDIDMEEKLSERLLKTKWKISKAHDASFILRFYGKKSTEEFKKYKDNPEKGGKQVPYRDYLRNIVRDVEPIFNYRTELMETMKEQGDAQGAVEKTYRSERYLKLLNAVTKIAHSGKMYRVTGRIYQETQVRLAVGCDHYIRGAGVICPDCGKYSPCRICHKEAYGHELNRSNVKLMRCYFCGRDGPIGTFCQHCNQIVARVHCEKCNLLDGMHHLGKCSTHCEKCGFCLVTYPWLIRHCEICGVCHGKDMKCIPPIKGQTECPVCCEPLFSCFSQDGILSLPCGHRLHSNCTDVMYKNYLYKCPLCQKLYLSDERRAIWESEMKREIALAPSNPKVRVCVVCAECGRHFRASENAKGHVCPGCGTANTFVP